MGNLNEIVFSKRFRNRLSDASCITITLPPVKEPVRWHISRQWARAAILSLALFLLLLFASGCGAVDHARVTARLEQRIAKLEKRWSEYVSIDAPSSARVDSSIIKIRKAIELLTWRLQRMQEK